jgi:hypothetical protein
LIISASNNYENIKKIILDVLNKNPKILPNVSKTEESTIFKLFELKHIREIYPKKDLTRFNPHILLLDIQSGKITLNLRFWISEIYKKDEIIS